MGFRNIIATIFLAMLLIISLSIVVLSSVYNSRPTTYIDIDGVASDEQYAYDSNNLSFSFFNTSGGNTSFSVFSVGSHQENEYIETIDIIFDIEAIGFTDDLWGLQYSDDYGASWQDLRTLQTGNVTKQLLVYSDIIESGDNLWTWNEVRNSLMIRVETANVGQIDAAQVNLYELYLNITYDDQGPEITLFEPLNLKNFTIGTINFSFSANDSLSGVKNCSLFINSSLNQSETSISEGETYNFTTTFLQGSYDWYVGCFDNSSGNNYDVSNTRIIRIDLLGPTIDLRGPPNDTLYIDSGNIIFNYSVYDLSDIANCSLVINGSINITNESVSKVSTQYFHQTFSDGTYTWVVNCSDTNNQTNQSILRSFTVNINNVPSVDLVVVDQDIVLNPGLTKNVLCNTTVSDLDGSEAISSVVATFYNDDYLLNSSDENSSHYTNSSCTELSSDATSKSFSCGFDVQYFARSGTWYCDINVSDNQSSSNSLQDATIIGSLFALNVSPQRIDYGYLYAGNTSESDVEITVFNLGNQEIDITLDAYAVFDGDGLAMNCSDNGNLSFSDERYSLSSGLAFVSMTPVSDEPYQLDEFNLVSKNDSYSGNKIVYWKVYVPKPKKGGCNGFVTFGAVAS